MLGYSLMIKISRLMQYICLVPSYEQSVYLLQSCLRLICLENQFSLISLSGRIVTVITPLNPVVINKFRRKALMGIWNVYGASLKSEDVFKLISLSFTLTYGFKASNNLASRKNKTLRIQMLGSVPHKCINWVCEPQFHVWR